MSHISGELMLFAAKVLILFLFIVGLLVTIIALVAKNRGRNQNRLIVNHLNEKYDEMKEILSENILPKKEYKKYLKAQKKARQAKEKCEYQKNNVYVLDFDGDMKASAVSDLREAITALLQIVTEQDEVVLRLESPGGLVPNYGLAAAQLIRLRKRNIPLTIIIDKVAASGGYLMACTGCKILAAPFAIIGSIGVVMQLPNFHRLLKNKNVDYVQLTAGDHKRTVTMFGENTKAGETKAQEELEAVHQSFKNLIQTYRQTIDIKKIATGEYWLGEQALHLNLIDAIQTSDDYLFEKSKIAEIYEIQHESKKSFLSKIPFLSSALTRIFHHIA
ncbi:MAG: protease SohB [Gammaproteobacteria bacterium RIFCSPHIGHO2_12_FULL_42_10]|nr:MAG: protease SohB [Gammaproteobacteria bacterium RIFCSPHIGHO2_12_FULL_42_10]